MQPRAELVSNDVTSIFSIYMKLTQKYNSVNLGQGMPDTDLATFMAPSLDQAVANKGNNQYCRVSGEVTLAREVAKEFGARFNRAINPDTEVHVAVGGTGCFFNTLSSFINPGDEIVCFEPSFAYFIPTMNLSGAVPRWVSLLEGNDITKMSFDSAKFEAAFNEKTRVLVINNPHNPLGRIFSLDELTYISEFLKAKFPKVLVLSDEVYSDVLYDSKQHVYIGSLPGMWERTVTFFSFGKSFGATGWRLGYAIGQASTIQYLAKVQAFSIYCVNTPCASAGALILNHARNQPYQDSPDYYTWLTKEYQNKKDQIVQILSESDLGLVLSVPQGGYFMVANIEKAIAGIPLKFFYEDFEEPTAREGTLAKYEDWYELESPFYSADYAYCNYLCVVRGITTWPLSAFYDTQLSKDPKLKKGTNCLRISLCKSQESIERLRAMLKK